MRYMTNLLTKIMAHAISVKSDAMHLGVVLLLLTTTLAVGATGIPETEPPPQSQYRTVTDMFERTVEVPVDPQRVVTAGRAVLMIADVLYAFEDAPDRLVGIGRISQGRGNFVAALDPDYEGKTIFERNVGPEQIASVQPDLVILKSFMKNTLGDPLERLGIPVVYVALETPEQYERDILLLGSVLNEEVRARQIVDYFRVERASIENTTAQIPASDVPSTLILYRRRSGNDVTFQVPPASWIQTRLVRSAGGAPVWVDEAVGGGWQTVGVEQIAQWNPEVIAIVSYNDNAEAIRDDLATDSAWRSLRAVEEGRFFAFPSDFYSWDQPDTRWILGLQWLASRLHPEAFPDLVLQDSAREFFRVMYGLNGTSYERLIVPTLTGDLD